MTDTPLCRLCRQPFAGFPMGETNGWRFVACTACGSVMTDPWVEAAEVEKFFGDVQPEAVHVPDPAAEIEQRKKLIRRIAGPASAGKTFLDISCRQGYAVMAAQALGFAATGIDPHDFFIRFAQTKYGEAPFAHRTVAEAADAGMQADMVFSIESFCEQTDPEGYAAALARLIAPGGALYLQEPDGNHFMLPRAFTRWSFVDPPLNFLYPSRKGMDALLTRHGLKVEKSFFGLKPFMRLIVRKV